jgi:hypothetical protein
MARPDLEEQLAEELETDYEIALLDGHECIESARREGQRYCAFDEPLDAAVFSALDDDDVRDVCLAVLVETAKSNIALRRALAHAIAKQNALGVLCVRNASFAEDLGL